MAGDFHRRIDELLSNVGSGVLVGRVVVDQVYAKYQHERLDLQHPRGGHAKYLERPLFDNSGTYLRRIADSVLSDGGKEGMIKSMEDLAGDGGVATEAPVLWGDLRRSGHPIVEDDERPIYDRPPLSRRLTEEELRAKGRLLPLPGPLLGYIWWHVEGHTSPPNHGGV